MVKEIRPLPPHRQYLYRSAHPHLHLPSRLPTRPNRLEAAILANSRNNQRTSRLVLLGLEEHGDIFGGKSESSAVGNSLSGDRVAWPLGIDAGDPEPFASGAELPSEVRRRQSVVLRQELEPVVFEIERRAVEGGNADA